MIFKIAEEVFDMLPEACFGIVAVSGVDNKHANSEIDSMLAENIAACEEIYKDTKVKNAEEIQPYREAFRAIGVNPNRYQCSIEALLDRIAKGKGFPHISPIVDLGNAVSLKYRIPIGAHDMATVEESLDVRPAKNGDTFVPFGNGEPETPDENEIVYVSGNQVRTRRWTWRQSEIGKITEDTTDLLFPIDGFNDFNKQAVIDARDELAADIEKYFGVKAAVGIIDKDNMTFEV